MNNWLKQGEIMRPNKIQMQIYEEYLWKGKVWADCPRQSGKTEIILHIAENEIKCKNKIYIKSLSVRSTQQILEKLKERLREPSWSALKRYVVKEEKDADVIFYDEIYYDMMQKRVDKKVVCLRTRPHRLLQFTYEDLGEAAKNHILKLLGQIPKERWDIEFNNGEPEKVAVKDSVSKKKVIK